MDGWTGGRVDRPRGILSGTRGWVAAHNVIVVCRYGRPALDGTRATRPRLGVLALVVALRSGGTERFVVCGEHEEGCFGVVLEVCDGVEMIMKRDVDVEG